jgi:hypothetical protein
MNENQIAKMEADVSAAEDQYFDARPQADTPGNRHLFRAGFERGYKANKKAVSDDGMKHLYDLYAFAFLDGYYDPTTIEHKIIAQKIHPHLKALNKELGFKK